MLDLAAQESVWVNVERLRSCGENECDILVWWQLVRLSLNGSWTWKDGRKFGKLGLNVYVQMCYFIWLSMLFFPGNKLCTKRITRNKHLNRSLHGNNLINEKKWDNILASAGEWVADFPIITFTLVTGKLSIDIKGFPFLFAWPSWNWFSADQCLWLFIGCDDFAAWRIAILLLLCGENWVCGFFG